MRCEYQAARHLCRCDFFSGATVDMLEVLLRTGSKAAAGGEHNKDGKGIALIVLNNRRDAGTAAPLALKCAENA